MSAPLLPLSKPINFISNTIISHVWHNIYKSAPIFIIYYFSYLFWIIFTFQSSSNRWILVGRLMIPRAYLLNYRYTAYCHIRYNAHKPILCFHTNHKLLQTTEDLHVYHQWKCPIEYVVIPIYKPANIRFCPYSLRKMSPCHITIYQKP